MVYWIVDGVVRDLQVAVCVSCLPLLQTTCQSASAQVMTDRFHPCRSTCNASPWTPPGSLAPRFLGFDHLLGPSPPSTNQGLSSQNHPLNKASRLLPHPLSQSSALGSGLFQSALLLSRVHGTSFFVDSAPRIANHCDEYLICRSTGEF